VVTKRTSLFKIGVAVLALGLATSLTGCGSTPTSPSNTEAANTKTVVVGMNSGLVPQFQAYADLYNATKPTAEIKIQAIPDAIPDYIQQLVTQGLSGTLPDIIFNYDNLNQQLAASNLLYDIKPWLAEGKDGLKGSSFVPAFLNQYIADPKTGAIGGIPVSADSTMLFYNRTLFAKAGVTDLPKDNWTWQDLYKAAQEISAKGAGQYWGLQTPLQTGDENAVNYPFLKAGGSSIYDAKTNKFDFANAKGLAVWKTLLAPYTEGYGTPVPTGQVVDYFAAGQVAMALNTRPAIARYRTGVKDDWDVINLPTLDGNATVGGGSYGLSISKKSTNKENAWKFLAWFFNTDKGMKAAEPNGVIPATSDGIANGSWRTDSNPVPKNLIPATEYAVKNAALPPAVPNAAASQLAPALAKAMQEVLVSGKSIKDAYTEAQDSLNALLK
jgi:multiple sugar transport system substrate-binding protein